MRLARHGLVAFFALALAGACSSKDDNAERDEELQSAEDFCAESVATTCAALAGCCANGTKFDAFECKRVNLATCFEAVGIKEVHSGAFKFDREAAARCLTPITSCPSAQSASKEPSQAEMIACNSVLTGFAPLGAGCTSSSDCAAVGEGAYPSCFRPAGSSVGGVCAKTMYSTDGSCGFFADSLEHRLCPEDKQCHIPLSAIPSADAQGKARFDIRGTCKPLAQVGQPCGPSEAGDYLECAKGLNCKYTGTTQSVCAQPLTKGQACSSSEECATALWCNPQTGLCDDLPDSPKQDGAYCYAASTAGDGGLGDGGNCSPENAACSAGTDCCSGVCDPYSGTCAPGSCSQVNAYCTSNGECCSGICSNNLCSAPSCVPTYGACSFDYDCCSGMCNSGTCL